MTVEKVIISQAAPADQTPYAALREKYGVQIDFRPFFHIEPLSSREFRAQRLNILDYTAIVFSARHTIDAFFRLCDELRVKVPETMKYFCSTEAVALDAIHRELERLGVTAERLTSDERLKIIAALEANGIFLLKGAVKDVAVGLHCSQASVYRYLSQVKNEAAGETGAEQ